MINPSISKLLLGIPEADAGALLNQFQVTWRVSHRDGAQVETITQDRDDGRYNLLLNDGIVVRVLPG